MNLKRRTAAMLLAVALALVPLSSGLAAAPPFSIRTTGSQPCIIGAGAGEGITVADAAGALDKLGLHDATINDLYGYTANSSQLLATGMSAHVPGLGAYKFVVRGDVTGSGQLNFSQLVYLCAVMHYPAQVPEHVRLAGDLNNSGDINITDIVIMARAYKNAGYLSGYAAQAPDVSQTDSALLAQMRRETLDGTNAVRARYGIAPLTENEDLNKAAMVRAQEMVVMGGMSHTRPDGSSCFDAYGSTAARAENVVVTYRTAVDDIAAASVKAWDESPGHHANMVNPEYVYMGSAYAQGTDGHWYGCQLFMGNGVVTWIGSVAPLA